MEKKTKLWLGAGLVAVAGYLLWKSKQANTKPPALTSDAKPAVATTATGTSNLVGVNGSQFFNPDTQKYMNASAAVMQVPQAGSFFDTKSTKLGVDAKWAKAEGLINSTNVKGAKVGSHNAGIFANQPFQQHPTNVVSSKMPLTAGATSGKQKQFTTHDGPVMKQYSGGVKSDSEKFNASGKFFEPRTAKYGQNQGVFAPAPKTTVMPKAVTQAAPTKMLVGSDGSKVDASNKAKMMGFLDSSKIWK